VPVDLMPFFDGPAATLAIQAIAGGRIVLGVGGGTRRMNPGVLPLVERQDPARRAPAGRGGRSRERRRVIDIWHIERVGRSRRSSRARLWTGSSGWSSTPPPPPLSARSTRTPSTGAVTAGRVSSTLRTSSPHSGPRGGRDHGAWRSSPRGIARWTSGRRRRAPSQRPRPPGSRTGDPLTRSEEVPGPRRC
jgi:hypothetical protein